MASAPKPRVKVPKTASAGEVIVIKTLISHEMESGQRKDKDGNPIPRKIINKFSCAFNGKPVFSCDLDPAVSANPYFEFSARVPESGTFTFIWVDDDGSVYTDEQSIKVE
ncbi:thiosulfate oxidation carrier complex protein SoxZ [Aquibium sp. ELW1220]|uniref:thiosulfate oxidation carrier complex protein SoxZ n=1 Tax=Aquibium sp. ELW1220 TaxID=2976766 RepID=UPI0025B09659|nr:thiosulfate oxidation carrier complex protein SoxZ [Aquibium sp. ELW1220]MDN2581833.1 thiosulfate oxidation carrier complex protein SoxZ [Aquibium sp. ELW1220]